MGDDVGADHQVERFVAHGPLVHPGTVGLAVLGEQALDEEVRGFGSFLREVLEILRAAVSAGDGGPRGLGVFAEQGGG